MKHIFSSFQFFLLSVVPLSVLAQPLVFVSEEFPPFEYFDEATAEAKGIDVDILKEIAKRLDLEIQIKFMPWARAMNDAKNGQVDAVFVLYRNEERAKDFYFTSEPLSYETATLITRSSSTKDAYLLEDIEGWKVAQIRDTRYSAQYDNYNGVERVWVKNNEQAIKLLKKQRVDAVIMNKFLYVYRKKAYGDFAGTKQLDLTIAKEPQYIAFTKKKGKEHAELARQFSKVTKALREDGFIHQVIRKYTKIDSRKKPLVSQ